MVWVSGEADFLSQFLILDCMFCGLGLNLLCFPPHSKKVSFDCWFHSSIFFCCLFTEKQKRERETV